MYHRTAHFSTSMSSLWLLVTFAAVVADQRVSYEGFKVYRIKTPTESQFDILHTFSNNSDYHFWSNFHEVGFDVDIMVGPRFQEHFVAVLHAQSIQYEIMIENLESFIHKERETQLIASRSGHSDGITFTQYNRYSDIQSYLVKLETEYPDIVTLFNAGYSVEKRNLSVIRISTDPSAGKPAIFIDGGIHAREWVSSATVLYIIHQLVENKTNRYMFKDVDWYILPLVNPDGYEYSFNVERFWRKNRSKHPSSSCVGVDLNRNFGFHWGEVGTSANPCSEIYRGESAFSEPEARAVRDAVLDIYNLRLYLTFHNYGQYILHPWGYGYIAPDDAPVLKLLGDLAAAGIYSVNNTTYRVGSVTQFLKPGAGGSDDWAKGEAGIKYSYTIELRGGGNNGFDLPRNLILASGKEAFEGVKAFWNYIQREGRD